MSHKMGVKKHLWWKFIVLSAPIALHNIIQAMVGCIDALMVGQLSQEDLATVGIANQVFFMACVTIFAIASGGAVFISRAWGNKNPVEVQKTTGISLCVCLAITLPLAITSYFKAYDILYFFSMDPVLCTQGQKFIEITSVSFIFTTLTIVLGVQLRCVGKGSLPMISGSISLVVTVIINYFLIFGHGHCPKLGLNGAAIATLSARAVEAAITVFFFIKHNPAFTKLSDCFAVFRSCRKDRQKAFASFLHITLPILLIEILWAIGQGVYKLVFGRMGTPELAAYTVLENLLNFFSAAAMGFANAASILIGYTLGSSDFKKAQSDANSFVCATFVFALPIAIVLFFTAPHLPYLFKKLDAQGVYFLKNGLRMCAVFLCFKNYNFLMTTGIFRVGGDGDYASLVSTISFVLFGIPVTLVGGLLYHWSFLTILLVIFLEENIRNFLLWQRYATGKWLHKDVKL